MSDVVAVVVVPIVFGDRRFRTASMCDVQKPEMQLKPEFYRVCARAMLSSICSQTKRAKNEIKVTFNLFLFFSRILQQCDTVCPYMRDIVFSLSLLPFFVK